MPNKWNSYYIFLKYYYRYVSFVRLRAELSSKNTTVTIHVEWTVSRKTDAKDSSEVTTTIRDIDLPPYVNEKFNPVRQTLMDILDDEANATNATIILQSAFPKFLKVTARTTNVVPQLMRSQRSGKYKPNAVRMI